AEARPPSRPVVALPKADPLDGPSPEPAVTAAFAPGAPLARRFLARRSASGADARHERLEQRQPVGSWCPRPCSVTTRARLSSRVSSCEKACELCAIKVEHLRTREFAVAEQVKREDRRVTSLAGQRDAPLVPKHDDLVVPSRHDTRG